MLDRAVSEQARNVLVTKVMPPRKRRNQREHATVGELIKRNRKSQRLTQKQLAVKLGTDPSYVARVESGEIKSPGLDSLRRFAEAFDVPMSALTGETGKSAEVEKAIMSYSGLDEEAKRTLIRMFRALDESKE